MGEEITKQEEKGEIGPIQATALRVALSAVRAAL